MPTHRSIHRAVARAGALLLLFASGCAMTKKKELRNALASPVPTASADLSAYRISFPDVLRIEIEGMPEASGLYPVQPEGKIVWREGAVSVEGSTTFLLRTKLAEEAGVSESAVRVEVAERRGRVIHVVGAVAGGTRKVDYRGPETALQVIQRCGGLHPDADLREVFVLRPNVVSGVPSQQYQVDLAAIYLSGDTRSDIPVQPNDEIVVGETRRANWIRILPRWMTPVYHKLCGLIPGLCPDKKNPEGTPISP